MLAALLVASPALANEMKFQGHALEVDGVGGAAQLVRVRGTRYAIPGTSTQVIGKARVCLSGKDGRAGIVSVDPAGGRLEAVTRVEYEEDISVHLARSWLTVEAEEGSFGIVLSRLGIRQQHPGNVNAEAEVFSPFLLRDDGVWKPAVAAVIEVEQSLVDCMFR